jgi:large conductance mechanosensitive channel
MLKEFKEFIARANIIDLAVAVIIGVAFGKIVTSFVDGIIMPPIGLLLGKVDFASLFYVLDKSKGMPVSLADAKAKAVPVIAYGAFINDIINFLIIALVIFLLVKIVNKMRNTDPSKKDCPYCLTAIPLKATRCSACCAELKTA